MTLTTAQSGAIKGLLIAIAAAATAYLADPSHLTFLSGSAALIVAAVASSLESYMKAQSGNTTALFGAVKLK